MFDSPLFDTAIALITLYLLFSQLTLSLVELPAGFLNTRGKYLHDRLLKALGSQAHAAFYAAASVQSLMLPRDQKSPLVRRFVSEYPAYISETLFAQTIIAWVSSLAKNAVPALPNPATPIDQFKAGLAFLTDPSFKELLETLYLNAIATAASTANPATPEEQGVALQKNVEGWFHDFGERMTGWYKRDNRKYLFWAGFLVAVLADVDTVRLSRFIADSSNAKARLALVEMGTKASQGEAPAGVTYNVTNLEEAKLYEQQRQIRLDTLLARGSRNLQNTLAAVPQVGLPLGFLRWTDHSTVRNSKTGKYEWAPSADDYQMPGYAQRRKLDPATGSSSPLSPQWSRLWPIGGWLLTAFAMMLGAPFWFETLAKFINIRNVGVKPASANRDET
ncbi:hypothetical protein [Hymenobacter cavernae]|uniref:Uncharacterized protein n=1 Tax=Hymenobacter cavernae TaxID=2044852 RepID=A0ABQ1TWM7_9BACT|nr:hypothetical protein [Hymenobacter cavernae]GGF04812.1 hypothetical protein GCM10011383_14940 [Hymenobacter cavernae]